ncbi:piggyBac transposable element-derived protein 4-like isoform X2 [Diorhabda sublineata]|uniref:piggyBac transposable element-derived protein 4-like isoform X2 n=1 Tax=Diorhabda sublineata TaxID=1163346 RepID=UPI0024E09CC1|nr:piggyBac transposable element-derived protein 4-like isoform X2 [Diorhabda sublineata]
MEQTVIKDEIEIHDDFICNTKVKQEFNDEMPSTAYQNVNTSSVHHIKEEISDDLETVREFEKSMVTIKKEESCNTFDKLSTQNKMEYMSIETRKPTKSQDRMDMEQTVIKDEIEIHDDFICNTKVKQEFNDEMPSAPFQNVNTSSMYHINEEISDDLETVREFEESMVTIKKEESCNTFDKLNIKNNFEYMRIKTGKSPKTQVKMVRPRRGTGKSEETGPQSVVPEPIPSTSTAPEPTTASAPHDGISSKRRKQEIVYSSSTIVYTREELMRMLAEEDEEDFNEMDESLEELDRENLFVEPLDEVEYDGDDMEFSVPVHGPIEQESVQVDNSNRLPNPPIARQWSRERPDVDPIPFTLNPGVAQDISGLSTPRDFLNLILTEEMMNHIIVQTNLYALFLSATSTAPRALIKTWKDLERDEFLYFLGLLFHTGTVSLNRLSDYWNTDPILFGLTSFRRVMSRDRFFGILQCLHFAKNPEPNEPTPADGLYKIRPLIDIFRRTMDALIIPTKNLYIDESTVLWRGRSVLRQYLRNKAHPYGIKMYMLNEASGLVLRFIVYTGASDQEIGGKGHADLVVRKLMDGKLDVGHSLFMDDFYNSVNLVHELLERKTYVTGTLRSNRKGNPPQVILAKTKRGEVVDYYSGEGVGVLNWRHKRVVLMISSEFSGKMNDVTTRRGIVIQQPEMVSKYNESMGGVDHLDQMMSYYPIERKTLKWSKKIGIHILHLCMYNAFILYNKCHPKMDLYDFRNSVVKSLLPPVTVSPMTSLPLKRGSKGLSPHFPSFFGVSHKSNKKIRKRCVFCAKNKKRQETAHLCPACPNKPPLCLVDCFVNYHKNMEL